MGCDVRHLNFIYGIVAVNPVIKTIDDVSHTNEGKYQHLTADTLKTDFAVQLSISCELLTVDTKFLNKILDKTQKFYKSS